MIAEVVAMRLRSWGLKMSVIAGLCFVALGVANVEPRGLEGHGSSLNAQLTMRDGSIRSVTLQGVGCTSSMCSRVRARSTDANTVWLDGLASVRGISSQGTTSPVSATFTFKDGSERQVSIVADNRVFYVQGHFGFAEKLDLSTVSKIVFE